MSIHKTTRRSCSAGLAIGLAIAMSPPAAGKDYPAREAESKNAVRLPAITPWHLEMADDRCRLARKFGTEEAPSLVSFEQIAPGHRFDLTITGPEIGELSDSGWIYLGMRSDLQMAQVNPLEGVTGFGKAFTLAGASISRFSGKRYQSESELIEPAVDLADASQVDRVVLRRANNTVSFETGNLKAAFEALNACTSDLIPAWGLNLEAHELYTPPLMPDGDRYFLRLKHRFAETSGVDGHKALLRVRAVIAANGSVLDCHFEYPLSTGGVQPDVCREIRQMRFEAAKDRQGNPIASYLAKSIVLWPYSPLSADAHGGRWGDS